MNVKYEDPQIGAVFNIVKVTRLFRNDNNRKCVEVECLICKKHKTMYIKDLFKDKYTSCTCQAAKHGDYSTRLYHTYHNMKYRCYNSNAHEFHNYGGKGIVVCTEWLGENGYSNFKKWALSNGYREDLTIDRIDNNGNYEPDNCQWLTRRDNTIKANKTCQHRHANKGRYYGIDPDGNYYEFDNANEFSREHNLRAGCVRQVANGEKHSHKKWQFGFVSEQDN